MNTTKTIDLKKPAIELAKDIMIDIRRLFIQQKKLSPCGFFFIMEKDNDIMSMSIPGIDTCFKDGKDIAEHIKNNYSKFQHGILKAGEKVIAVFVIANHWHNCIIKGKKINLNVQEKSSIDSYFSTLKIDSILGILVFEDQSSVSIGNAYEKKDNVIRFHAELICTSPPYPFLFFPG